LTESTLIVAGVHTHADTIHVAVISMTGAAVGDREFPTTRTGFASAIRFLTSLGQVTRIVQRRLALGHTRMEILRKLKRAIAWEVFKLLTRQIAVPDYADLGPARQAKNITVTAAANHFGIWPTVISRIERGLQRDDAFADTYRVWLEAVDRNRSIKLTHLPPMLVGADTVGAFESTAERKRGAVADLSGDGGNGVIAGAQ
jgi:hypothetical protein